MHKFMSIATFSLLALAICGLAKAGVNLCPAQAQVFQVSISNLGKLIPNSYCLQKGKEVQELSVRHSVSTLHVPVLFYDKELVSFRAQVGQISYKTLVRTMHIAKFTFFPERMLPELSKYYEMGRRLLEELEPGTHSLFMAKVQILTYSGIRLTPQTSGEEVTIKVLELLEGGLPKDNYVVRTDTRQFTEIDGVADFSVNRDYYIMGEFKEGNIRLFWGGYDVGIGPWSY